MHGLKDGGRSALVGVMMVVMLIGGGIASAQAPKKSAPQDQAAEAVQPDPMVAEAAARKDIEATFGFVPQFLTAVPGALLPAFWQGLKGFEMADTKLDKKTKELIGVAVAAQIPCDYCIQFHTEGAKLNGATDQEIKEAIAMAGLTRQASTMVNGAMIDKGRFKKDLSRIVRETKQQQAVK